MSKSIWRILLLCISALLLWRAGSALIPLWRYYQLDTLIPVNIERWKVEKKGGAEYALVAFYSYEFQGKRYEGQTEFQKPYLPNHYAAEDQIKQYSKKSWNGWIKSKKPEISSLERPFPYLKIFYSILVLGILLYFIYLYYTL